MLSYMRAEDGTYSVLAARRGNLFICGAFVLVGKRSLLCTDVGKPRFFVYHFIRGKSALKAGKRRIIIAVGNISAV